MVVRGQSLVFGGQDVLNTRALLGAVVVPIWRSGMSSKAFYLHARFGIDWRFLLPIVTGFFQVTFLSLAKLANFNVGGSVRSLEVAQDCFILLQEEIFILSRTHAVTRVFVHGAV